MYEVWQVTDGREAGELIITTALGYAEMSAKLRIRLSKVGTTKNPTAGELDRFRRLLTIDPDLGSRDLGPNADELASSGEDRQKAEHLPEGAGRHATGAKRELSR